MVTVVRPVRDCGPHPPGPGPPGPPILSLQPLHRGLRDGKALPPDREWDGLIAHRDYPMISLDNNAAERAIRLPVMTRRNADGSRNEDSARLAATAWTVTTTAQMADLNVLTYLTAYFDACGRNGRKPPPGPGASNDS